MYSYYVYILATRRNGTLYIGVTNDIVRRVWEHKTGFNKGFTKRYGIHRLVYYEETDDIGWAIWREKCLKKWNRKWKLRLIESENPEWRDLSKDFMEQPLTLSPPRRRGSSRRRLLFWIPACAGMTKPRGV